MGVLARNGVRAPEEDVMISERASSSLTVRIWEYEEALYLNESI